MRAFYKGLVYDPGMRGRWLFVAAVLTGLQAAACSSPSSPVSPQPGVTPSAFRFTVAPIVMGEHGIIRHMGYSWIGDIQTVAVFADSRSANETTLAVSAPASGVVTSTRAVQFEGVRIDVAVTGGYRYYLTGLESASVTVGQNVEAGERVGTRTSNRVLGNVGLGLINPTRNNEFAIAARYPDDIRYADDPLAHFAEPLRSDLRARLHPSNADPDLSFDMPGRLAGLWYLPSVPFGDSASRDYRDGRLWFYYTQMIPATSRTLRASWAGPYDGSWTATVENGPAPEQVGVESGMVRYDMRPFGGGTAAPIILLIQMIDANSLRFEAFDGYYTPNPAGFTDKARIYVR